MRLAAVSRLVAISSRRPGGRTRSARRRRRALARSRRRPGGAHDARRGRSSTCGSIRRASVVSDSTPSRRGSTPRAALGAASPSLATAYCEATARPGDVGAATLDAAASVATALRADGRLAWRARRALLSRGASTRDPVLDAGTCRAGDGSRQHCERDSMTASTSACCRRGGSMEPGERASWLDAVELLARKTRTDGGRALSGSSEHARRGATTGPRGTPRRPARRRRRRLALGRREHSCRRWRHWSRVPRQGQALGLDLTLSRGRGVPPGVAPAPFARCRSFFFEEGTTERFEPWWPTASESPPRTPTRDGRTSRSNRGDERRRAARVAGVGRVGRSAGRCCERSCRCCRACPPHRDRSGASNCGAPLEAGAHDPTIALPTSIDTLDGYEDNAGSTACRGAPCGAGGFTGRTAISPSRQRSRRTTGHRFSTILFLLARRIAWPSRGRRIPGSPPSSPGPVAGCLRCGSITRSPHHPCSRRRAWRWA